MWRESIPGTVICCLTTVTAFKCGGQKLCSYFIGDKLWLIQLLNYMYILKAYNLFRAGFHQLKEYGTKRKEKGRKWRRRRRV